HMDADGKLVQSIFDPNDFCKNPDPEKRSAFSELFLLNESSYECEPVAQLGGGTGLTFYNNRYFSFRPLDGQIFDLIEASNSSSPYFLLPETGILGGKEVFPAYSKDIIFNADDITTIEDQIYYLKNQALYALIDPKETEQDRKSVV